MTAHMYNWADPRFDASPFHKWEKEGDSIEGVIEDITTTTFPAKDDEPEKTYPVLHLDTANGRKELTVSSVDLLQKTKVLNPQIGDYYSAAWVATAGKKRIFIVQSKKLETAPKADSTMAGSTPATAAPASNQERAPF